jgi:DNA helicase IV
LAIETARYFASLGKSVLLTCFNNNLELILRQDESLLHLVKQQYGAGLDIASFHHIADYFLNRANQNRNRRNQPSLTRGREWNDPHYAQDVTIAVKEFPLRYDVIVIDEGQDFDARWVDALASALRDSGDTRMIFFFDPHQRLYDRGNPAAIIKNHQLSVFPLFTNCRNPAPVHKAAMRYHEQGDLFTPLVDVGPEPMRVEVDRSSDAQLRALGQWLNVMKPDPHEVVVLTPHGDSNPRRQWLANTSVGQYMLTNDVETWLSKKNQKSILCTSVYKFKGLEAPFVLVVELEGISDHRRQPVLYTALSRAKYQLIYFLPKGLQI